MNIRCQFAHFNCWDVIEPPLCCLSGISFHPSGSFLASSSLDGTIKIWDLRQGTLFYTLFGHEGATLGLEFSPAGDFFASGGADDQVMVWKTNFDRDLDMFTIVPPVKKHSNHPDMTKPSLPVAQQENLGTMQTGQTHDKPKQKNGSARKCHSGKKKQTADPPDSRCAEHKSEPSNELERIQFEANGRENTAEPTLDEVLGEGNGSPVMLPSPLDLDSIPQPLAATLQHIIGELNVVSQTLGLVVQRLTINEDRVKRIEQSLLNKSEGPAVAKSSEVDSQEN